MTGYLERIKNQKTPTLDTALTALTPKGSKGSIDGRHISRIEPGKGSKGSIDGRHISRIDLPAFCRHDCPGLEGVTVAGADVPGCTLPGTSTWRPLRDMDECPALAKRGVEALPAFCRRRGCGRLHVADGVSWCCLESTAREWRRVRLGTMAACSEAAP